MSIDNPPKVTIMLPVKNESRYILQTLEQIYNQTYPNSHLEVLICDGMSTDDTVVLVEKYASDHPDMDIRVLENKKQISSAGRNLAVKEAHGDYILLIDGHVYIPSDSMIEDAVKLATEHSASVLGRPQPLTPPDIDKFQQSVALARQSRLAHSQESFIYSDYEGWVSPISVAVMYKKEVFEQCGMFDEKFDAAEDLEFNYRLEKAGFRCFISPKMTIYYYPRDSYTGLFRQLSRYGLGRASFVMKHPERFTPETVVPAAFLLFMAIFGFSGMFYKPAWIVLVSVLSVYLALSIGDSFITARKYGLGKVFRLPSIIFTIHVSLGYGFIKGVIKRLLGNSAESK